MTPRNEIAPLSIVILGTCDTKLPELLYLRSQIFLHAADTSITLVDVGRDHINDPAISISQYEVVSKYGSPPSDLPSLPRGEVMQYLTDCATQYLKEAYSDGSLHGVISIGGSGGTSLASAAMRRGLPFLIPKLIVSTVASGDTAPFVGESDITLMYSIVDIAGSNGILDGVLDNAAGAIVGMARAYRKRQLLESKQAADTMTRKKKGKRIGITMFGVTTPCVDAIRQHLASTNPEHEIYVFHATGHGGRAMERLIASSGLDAIIDLTTSEIADEIVGGVMSAGSQRLEAAARAGLPQIVSVGACDMVNFGAEHTVPPKFVVGDEARKLYVHNSSVTLIRTTVDECRRIGEFIAGKLKSCCKRPELVQVVLPTGGVSMLSTPGGVYADEKADEALFGAVENGLEGTGIEVVRDKREVNDEGFARELGDRLVRLIDRAGEDGAARMKNDQSNP
ncbi:MAG: hypothetical protein Q9220_003266 [cf. Caloplaca sp. 1 TL-2023]